MKHYAHYYFKPGAVRPEAIQGGCVRWYRLGENLIWGCSFATSGRGVHHDASATLS